MSRSPTPPLPPAGIELKWLALAAAVGAIGMWLVLSRGADRDAGLSAAQPAATTAAANVASSPALSTASPWPAAPAAAPSAAPPKPVAAVRREDTALPSPELGPPIGDPADYVLDDATLSRRARTQFGLDCPGIVERRARRSGRFEVICSNGLRLRVDLMGDGPPGISAVETATRPVRARSAAASDPADRE